MISVDLAIWYNINTTKAFVGSQSFKNLWLITIAVEHRNIFKIKSQPFFLILIFFEFFSTLTNAQCLISGIILDNRGNPVGFADVFALPSDTTKIQYHSISNNAGSFIISCPVGIYTLKFKLLGSVLFQKHIELFENFDMGTINLTQNRVLKEITVKAQKNLIERLSDRIVFNVDKSSVSQGMNAIDVLNQTPLIEVTEDKVRLFGKDNLSVMINGRMLRMSIDELKSRLKSIRSENIKKIEVFTIPPSKYSADGNSGIVNIVFKNDPLLGWLFTTGISYTKRTYSNLTPSFDVAYKSKKLDFSIGNSGFIESKQYFSSSSFNFPQNTISYLVPRKINSLNYSTNVTASYSFNKNMQIGMAADWLIENGKLHSTITNTFSTNKPYTVDSIDNGYSNTPTNYNFGSISAYLDVKLDTNGKKITFNVSDFSKRTRTKNNIFSTTNYRDTNTISNITASSYHGILYGVDVALPYSKFSIETGMSLSLINNYFESSLNISNKGIGIRQASDNYIYKENVAAGYLSINTNFCKQFSTKVGLRYEYTLTNGNSVSMGQVTRSSYGDLFPTINFSFTATDNTIFTIGYSKRLQRPDFLSLNPFLNYLAYNSYTTGNPNLFPSYSNNLEVGFTYKSNLSLSTFLGRLQNGTDYTTTFLPSLNFVTKPSNYFNKNSVGANLNYTYRLGQWLSSYNSVNFSLSRSKPFDTLIKQASISGHETGFFSRNTITINKSNTCFLSLNISEWIPSTYGFLESKGRSQIDAGFRIKKKNLELSIMLYDLLRKGANIGKVQYLTFVKYYRNYNDIQSLNISLFYHFGNKKVRTTDVNIENENKYRAVSN